MKDQSDKTWDLSRAVLIDICKDGVVSIRPTRATPRRQGAALPFYSTDTVEQATLLVRLVCKLNYDEEFWVWDFTGEVEDIERVAGRFRLIETLYFPEWKKRD